MMNDDYEGYCNKPEPITAFMDKVDYDEELGQASDGNKMFPSEASLRRHKPCTKHCGVVEVSVEFVRVVQETDHSEKIAEAFARRARGEDMRGPMNFRPVVRKGTAELLQLTRGVSKDQQSDLLEYIGRLEQSEIRLLQKIRPLVERFDAESFEPKVKGQSEDA
jgi:hypothetical protein